MLPIRPASSSGTNSYCENILSQVLGSETVSGEFGMNPIEFWKSSEQIMNEFRVNSELVPNDL